MIIGRFRGEPRLTIVLTRKRDVFIVAPLHVRRRRVCLKRAVPGDWRLIQLISHLNDVYGDRFAQSGGVEWVS